MRKTINVPNILYNMSTDEYIDRKGEVDEGAEGLECWVRVAACIIKKTSQHTSMLDKINTKNIKPLSVKLKTARLYSWNPDMECPVLSVCQGDS